MTDEFPMKAPSSVWSRFFFVWLLLFNTPQCIQYIHVFHDSLKCIFCSREPLISRVGWIHLIIVIQYLFVKPKSQVIRRWFGLLDSSGVIWASFPLTDKTFNCFFQSCSDKFPHIWWCLCNLSGLMMNEGSLLCFNHNLESCGVCSPCFDTVHLTAPTLLHYSTTTSVLTRHSTRHRNRRKMTESMKCEQINKMLGFGWVLNHAEDGTKTTSQTWSCARWSQGLKVRFTHTYETVLSPDMSWSHDEWCAEYSAKLFSVLFVCL